jgi:flagella basal body P-ring formation protein FlgA
MKRFALLLIAAGQLALAAPALDAATFRFKDAAIVSAPVVRVGDVADVAAPDAAETERIKQISLGPAPAPGRQLRLDLAAIRSRLESQGVNLSAAEFTGSSLVTVATAGEPRTRESFTRRVSPTAARLQVERAQALVADAIAEILRLRAPELAAATVDVQIAPQDAAVILMSASAAAGRLQVSGGGAPWDVPQKMVVHVADSDGTPHDLLVQVAIARLPKVVTVNYAVPRGQILRREDLTLRTVDESSVGIVRIEDVLNKETTRAIRAGEPIGPSDVQPVPLVRAGDIVTVVSRQPGVVVRRPMKARNQGAAADTIVLVSLDGSTQVTARVIGYHEAQVIGSETQPPPGPGIADGRITFE